MSNLNKCMLMGRLTRDPELRYTPQGTAVTDLGLAINREFTAGTERRKETTFIDVTLWKRQAEVVCEYLRKGSPLYVEGRLSMDSWEGKDGQKRSQLRVVAENFQFIGGRNEGESGYSGGGKQSTGGESQFRPAQGRSGGFEGPAPSPIPTGEGSGQQGMEVAEDDIPF